MPALRRLAVFCLILYLAAFIYRIYLRKYYIWLPNYTAAAFRARETPQKPVHILFFFTDHFEPGRRFERVQRWLNEYPQLAERHKDSTGRVLQHTWFYPAEQPINENLEALRKLVLGGYGEVELHLHHNHDTRESALRKYQAGIAWFQKFGFLKTTDGQTRFAFIHGSNGLDNSLGPRACGVNRELELLRQLGCFADFTFPNAWDQSQPPFANTIYAATDDDRPKSYDRGTPLAVGRIEMSDLVIFQGPLRLVPALDLKRLFFILEDADIHPTMPLTERRVDAWIRANVHVQGRPEWVFVKVYSHAASSDAEITEVLGPDFEHALSYLENRYNDGINYVLHYVTAREAYNVARAAAAGKTGDPNQYLNWAIPPYITRAVKQFSREWNPILSRPR